MHNLDSTELEEAHAEGQGELEDFTYISLELGKGIIAAHIKRGHLMLHKEYPWGRIMGTTEDLHISLGYLQRMSCCKASWIFRNLNRVVKTYWKLTPEDRVEELCWNRKFWVVDKDPTYGRDHKADITDSEWMEIKEQWSAGELYYNSVQKAVQNSYKEQYHMQQYCRRQCSKAAVEPIEEDLEKLWNTWNWGYMKRQQRLVKVAAIRAEEKRVMLDEKGKRVRPPPWCEVGSKWKLLNGFQRHRRDPDFKGVLLHGLPESEIFDLADYITGWIAQIHAPHKGEGWIKKTHKIVDERKLHVTLWEGTNLVIKPGT